jgi:ketosteroid isomerase-like protein
MSALRRFATADMGFSGPGVGDITMEQYLSLVDSIVPLLDAPLAFTIHDVMLEGDRIAAEVESHPPLKDGKVYNNKYHFKILLRDHKKARIREYADTKHLVETFSLS